MNRLSTRPVSIVSVPSAAFAVALAVALALLAAACSSDAPSVADDGASATSSSVGTVAAEQELEPESESEPDAGLTETPPVESALDSGFLGEQLADVSFPDDEGSMMIAVMSDGLVAFSSVGSDRAGGSPDPSTPFRIGSVTKVFTSVLTLQLVDEGLVELDAPAADYVTRVPVPDGVTVRHLLAHTSGIPNYTEVPTFFARAMIDPSLARTPEDTASVVAGVEPAFEPGDRFAYSNTNYLVLGVLIEEVTGRSYAEELQARIVEPLGLPTTYLAGFDDGPAPFGAYTSLGGIDLADYDYTSLATDAWAAGAIVSSADDLHTLFLALFEGELISPASLEAMTDADQYGLGMMVLDPVIFGHNGGIPGYSTLVAHAPGSSTTAFWIATNDAVQLEGVAPVLERMAS